MKNRPSKLKIIDFLRKIIHTISNNKMRQPTIYVVPSAPEEELAAIIALFRKPASPELPLKKRRSHRRPRRVEIEDDLDKELASLMIDPKKPALDKA